MGYIIFRLLNMEVDKPDRVEANNRGVNPCTVIDAQRKYKTATWAHYRLSEIP